MRSIGYNGQPAREPFRRVDPPVPVLVDSSALHPPPPHRLQPGRSTGEPRCARCAPVVGSHPNTACGCGLVTYTIDYGPRCGSVTHWMPAWMLKPAHVSG